MYNSSDFERLFIRYKAEAIPQGESVQDFCVRNKMPHNLFQIPIYNYFRIVKIFIIMHNAIFFYRISWWLYLHHVPFLPKLITLIIFLIYNSKVPYQAEIGKGTRLGYRGVGVIIHSKAKAGSYCSVG